MSGDGDGDYVTCDLGDVECTPRFCDFVFDCVTIPHHHKLL